MNLFVIVKSSHKMNGHDCKKITWNQGNLDYNYSGTSWISLWGKSIQIQNQPMTELVNWKSVQKISIEKFLFVWRIGISMPFAKSGLACLVKVVQRACIFFPGLPSVLILPLCWRRQNIAGLHTLAPHGTNPNLYFVCEFSSRWTSWWQQAQWCCSVVMTHPRLKTFARGCDLVLVCVWPSKRSRGFLE